MSTETMQHVETKACERCGSEFTRRRSPSEWRESRVQFAKRRFCSRRCATLALAAVRDAGREARATERTEDLQFLDSCRVGASEAARRVDFPTVPALEKFCERHNLMALFWRMKHREHVCHPAHCREVTS